MWFRIKKLCPSTFRCTVVAPAICSDVLLQHGNKFYLTFVPFLTSIVICYVSLLHQDFLSELFAYWPPDEQQNQSSISSKLLFKTVLFLTFPRTFNSTPKFAVECLEWVLGWGGVCTRLQIISLTGEWVYWPRYSWFSSVPPDIVMIVHQIMPRPLRSTYVQIHYSLIILSFEAKQFELQIASINNS